MLPELTVGVVVSLFPSRSCLLQNLLPTNPGTQMARIFRMSRAADDLQFMYAYTTRALSSKCVCVCVCVPQVFIMSHTTDSPFLKLTCDNWIGLSCVCVCAYTAMYHRARNIRVEGRGARAPTAAAAQVLVPVWWCLQFHRCAGAGQLRGLSPALRARRNGTMRG